MTTPQITRPGRFAGLVYRMLLALYPAAFRREFGAQMRQDFQALYADRKRSGGRWSGVAFWMLMVRDLFASLAREYGQIAIRPSRWSWMRVLTVLSLIVAGDHLVQAINGVAGVELYWLPDSWWPVHVLIQVLPIPIVFAFALWAMPATKRMQRLARGISLTLGLTAFVPRIAWIIGTLLRAPIDAKGQPLTFGAWTDGIMAVNGSAYMLAFWTLIVITARRRDYRWWSLAMLMITIAGRGAWLAGRLGYTRMISGQGWDDLRIYLLPFDLIVVLAWVIIAARLWMIRRPQERPRVA